MFEPWSQWLEDLIGALIILLQSTPDSEKFNTSCSYKHVSRLTTNPDPNATEKHRSDANGKWCKADFMKSINRKNAHSIVLVIATAILILNSASFIYDVNYFMEKENLKKNLQFNTLSTLSLKKLHVYSTKWLIGSISPSRQGLCHFSSVLRVFINHVIMLNLLLCIATLFIASAESL